jgi:hypothetical protein
MVPAVWANDLREDRMPSRVDGGVWECPIEMVQISANRLA